MSSPESEPAGAAGRLLVVDDDTVHRMVICKVASRVGYEAVGAASRAEAKAAIEAGDFVLATIDLSLGEQSGVDVITDIADSGRKPQIIIISGSEGSARDRAARMAAAFGLPVAAALPKPVDLAQLRTLFEIARAQATVAAPRLHPDAH